MKFTTEDGHIPEGWHCAREDAVGVFSGGKAVIIHTTTVWYNEAREYAKRQKVQ